jgi:hypothetical protein
LGLITEEQSSTDPGVVSDDLAGNNIHVCNADDNIIFTPVCKLELDINISSIWPQSKKHAIEY